MLGGAVHTLGGRGGRGRSGGLRSQTIARAVPLEASAPLGVRRGHLASGRGGTRHRRDPIAGVDRARTTRAAPAPPAAACRWRVPPKSHARLPPTRAMLGSALVHDSALTITLAGREDLLPGGGELCAKAFGL